MAPNKKSVSTLSNLTVTRHTWTQSFDKLMQQPHLVTLLCACINTQTCGM